MADNPNKHELSVFQEFVNLALSIQGQLGEYYKGHRYLRDWLTEAIYLPAVKAFLTDRPTRSSRQPINRVATQLSDRTRTAGTVYAIK